MAMFNSYQRVFLSQEFLRTCNFQAMIGLSQLETNSFRGRFPFYKHIYYSTNHQGCYILSKHI